MLNSELSFADSYKIRRKSYKLQKKSNSIFLDSLRETLQLL
jgi:hypothetical protein